MLLLVIVIVLVIVIGLQGPGGAHGAERQLTIGDRVVEELFSMEVEAEGARVADGEVAEVTEEVGVEGGFDLTHGGSAGEDGSDPVLGMAVAGSGGKITGGG